MTYQTAANTANNSNVNKSGGGFSYGYGARVDADTTNNSVGQQYLQSKESTNQFIKNYSIKKRA